MKKLLLLLALGLAGFYLQSRLLFSENRLQQWVAEHHARAMSGEGSACDDYAEGAQVRLKAPGPKGLWEVEGGKAEACGYLKQSAALLTLMQAQTHTNYEGLSIERDGFPWMQARVAFTSRTSMKISVLPEFNTTTEEVLQLRRGLFGGLRIVSQEATGRLN